MYINKMNYHFRCHSHLTVQHIHTVLAIEKKEVMADPEILSISTFLF